MWDFLTSCAVVLYIMEMGMMVCHSWLKAGFIFGYWFDFLVQIKSQFKCVAWETPRKWLTIIL
jgi:hypothetical protein